VVLVLLVAWSGNDWVQDEDASDFLNNQLPKLDHCRLGR